MPTPTEVHLAIDEHTRQSWVTPPIDPVVLVVFGGQEDLAFSEGVDPYVKLSVHFATNKQMELPNNCFRRHTGHILFLVHHRLGTGDISLTAMQQRIGKDFASRSIGGATTMDVLLVASSRTANWAITGLRVPFFFDELL